MVDLFYFFEAHDSVHGKGTVAESYPAQAAHFVKIEQAQSVYAIFMKRFAYHKYYKLFSIFSARDFFKNFFNFFQNVHPLVYSFPFTNANKFNAFYRRKFGIKIFLKRKLLKTTCKRFRLVIYLKTFLGNHRLFKTVSTIIFYSLGGINHERTIYVVLLHFWYSWFCRASYFLLLAAIAHQVLSEASKEINVYVDKGYKSYVEEAAKLEKKWRKVNIKTGDALVDWITFLW